MKGASVNLDVTSFLWLRGLATLTRTTKFAVDYLFMVGVFHQGKNVQHTSFRLDKT